MIKHILIVTKQDTLYATLANTFAEKEWLTYHTTTAVAVVEKIKHHRIDGILWDLQISNLDTSLATLELIRNEILCPIIAILPSENLEIAEKLLQEHIDDYLVMPLHPSVIIALFEQRWWHDLRKFKSLHGEKSSKNEKASSFKLSNKDLTLDLLKHEVKLRGSLVDLTPKEFKLLKFLLKHQSQVLSREQLLKSVWGYDYIGTSRIIDIHISHLRDKLEKDPQHPNILKTVRGFGYIFQP